MEMLSNILIYFGLKTAEEPRDPFELVRSEDFYSLSRSAVINKASAYVQNDENQPLLPLFTPFEVDEDAGREQQYGTNEYVACLKVYKGQHEHRDQQAYKATVWIFKHVV
ncbi:hypothetical protein GGI00_002182 [Coemansia sp. RSA 2681]|nr:hypothetical protein GGI00_002182 [Coemansia sp. RSA 2681]KAJ2459569.1 hypothetical protein GGF42_001383 [Coemansia sp. RSA 2424]